MRPPFKMPPVGANLLSIERAFAPSSLPPILQQRGPLVAEGEYQATHEWNEEGATEVGLAVGAAVVVLAYVTVKALKPGKHKTA
jgi:hypothetical protein